MWSLVLSCVWSPPAMRVAAKEVRDDDLDLAEPGRDSALL